MKYKGKKANKEELIYTFCVISMKKNYLICCFDSRQRISFFGNTDVLDFCEKKLEGLSKISVAMKEIDCLPTLCTLVRTLDLSVMIRVLELLQCCVTNILKHVVEYLIS